MSYAHESHVQYRETLGFRASNEVVRERELRAERRSERAAEARARVRGKA